MRTYLFDNDYGTYRVTIVAGESAYDAEQATLDALAPRNQYGYRESAALCRAQERSRIIAGKLEQGKYGWYLRYASGTQNFGIIYSTRERGGPLDGSLEDAERAAIEWVAADPSHRYVERIERAGQ